MARGRHVALIAGSGFGKTTLAADFARSRRVAWVRLDAEDAAPTSFLDYLVAAIKQSLFPSVIARAHEGFTTEATALIPQANTRAGAVAALDALVADLEEQLQEPLLLVLDDYHLAASPTVDALVERLAGYLPEPVRLLVTARHEPAWGLRAMQAKREFEVLGEAALAFDPEELARLAPAVDPAERAALLAETGGWPAGMGLTPAARESYLEEQVLRALPGDLQAFLLRAALVDTFDAALCENAFGSAPDPARDELLIRQHIAERVGPGQLALLPPLRELLRARFLKTVPRAEQAQVARSLGQALVARGQVATAVQLGVALGEAGWAADVLAGVAGDWLRRGELDALASALAALGPAAERPDLQLYVGGLARRNGDFDRADAAFEKARRERDCEPLALLGLAMSAASAGRVEAALQLLAEARPGLPERPAVALDVMNLDGGLALLRGDTAAAAGHFEAALRLARRAEDRYAEGRAMHNLGVCYTRLGELERALACYDAALAAGPAGAPAIAMTPVNRALVLIELDRAADGLAAAREALAAARRLQAATEEGYALRTLGFANMRLGQLDLAERNFHEAEQLARRTNDALGLAFSLGFRAEWALGRGAVAEAGRLLEEAETAAGGPEAARAFLELRHVRAKLAAHAGRSAEVEAWLAELRDRADMPSYRHMIEELTASEKPRPAPPAAELVTRCFGALEVVRDGVAVTEKEWQSARARALWVFLLHTPPGANRQRLIEALYPDEEPGESSLYMNLTRLRKAIEPTLEKGQPSRWLLRREGAYRFNWEGAYALDTEDFTRAMAAGRAARDDAAPYEAALALYRGEFFPECELDWALALRHGFREEALAACRALLPLYEARDAAAVMPLIRRALAIDPLSEEFNRELILRHLEAGETRLAREHYALVERRFREVLDLPPPEDLAALVGGGS